MECFYENPFENGTKVHAIKMDLRKPEKVREFCLYVKKLCREGETLKAVITNSGVALGGPVENIPMTLYRESFQINYFGTVAVIQSLIPEIIRDKGRIMIHGSMAGRNQRPDTLSQAID